MEYFSYGQLQMFPTGNRSFTVNSQALFNLTIVNQQMDDAVNKWLYYLKLHKYQWFFLALSYLEIEVINQDNIDEFITKVNINSITKGAKKKICLSTKTLRNRTQNFKHILMVIIFSNISTKLLN